MNSKRIYLHLLLILIPFSLSAYDTILMNRHLNDSGTKLRWESQGGEEQSLKVTLYENSRILWSFSTADITVFLNNHEIPQSSYALYGDVVTFPVTTESESETLKRRQVALDVKTGELLWERDLFCGITQEYFYSWSDGEKLIIHNVHEYEGTQLICLDLKSGETLWQTSESFPQPALPVDLGESLVLHSGLMREFQIISKTDGSIQSYQTSSPVQIWRDRPLFLRQEGEICRVIALREDGSEEILFAIPDEEGDSIYSYKRDNFSPFFRALYKPIQNWALYKDSLILQRQNGEGPSALVAYSLTGSGNILWEIPLRENREFELDRDYSSSLSHMNINIYSPLLGRPETALFYQLTNRYLPLFVYDRKHSRSNLALIDLEEGTPLFLPEIYGVSSAYIFQDIFRSGENFYYFLQRFSESEEGPSLLLKLNGSTGQISEVHRYKSNFPDEEKWRKNPFLYLYQNGMNVLKWEPLTEELKEQLMRDPGLPQKALE